MARLRNCLKGDARQCVQHLLSTSTQPELIIRLLKKNFGRIDLLVDKALEDLRRLPALGPSATDLNEFATKIVNIVSTLCELDSKNYSNNPLLIREITDRLSPHIRSRWCAYAKENIKSGKYELMLMADFLMEESDAELEFSHARMPGTSRRRETVPKETVRPPTASRPVQGRGTRKAQVQYHATEQTCTMQGNAEGRREPCLCCGGDHRTPECKRVLCMNTGARWDWAKNNRVCFGCLNSKHSKAKCRSKTCGNNGCYRRHHKLLHSDGSLSTDAQARQPPPRAAVATSHSAASDESGQPQAAKRMEPEITTSTAARVNSTSSRVFLKMVPVTVQGPKGNVDTYAMLDDGSTLSLVQADLAEAIGVTGPETPLCLAGVSNMEAAPEISQQVKIRVRGKGLETAYDLVFTTVRRLGLRTQRMDQQTQEMEHLRDLPNACYDEAVPRLLVGSDQLPVLLPQEVKLRGLDEPAAVLTGLGWVVFGGKPRIVGPPEKHVSMHCRQEDNEHLDEMLREYFNVDSLGIKNAKKVDPGVQRALDIFDNTVKTIDGPRYEVGQLWREDEPRMPPSLNTAMSRLKGIERKMDRDPAFAASYTEQIDNLLGKGHAEPLQKPPDSDLTWILPHFAVTNPNKPGKIRLVFDAACRSQGKCLNDFLLEGPDLLQSLIGILFRFREGPFAVVADLQEMFLQVKIRDEDQPSQTFLWRGDRRTGSPQFYKMTSMLFGAASSPFLAHSVRNRNAQDNAEEFPDAVEDINRNHYMDDYVASYPNEEELVHRATQVAASHARGGFKLRGWTSNSLKMLNGIPQELHANIPAQLGKKGNKILGMFWNPETDELGFNTAMLRVPEEVRSMHTTPTKRQMLSAVISVYDPLGLLSHYTITAKVQLQNLWAKKLDWDSPLPEEDARDFEDWLQALDSVAALRIPRCYLSTGAAAVSLQLHVFVDASSKAYACVAYWRAKHQEGPVQVSMVAAKSKVGPTRQLSVPRMELQSALIGSRIQQVIREEHRLTPDQIVMWTDSRTVQHWIRNDAKRYSAYVSNRLGEMAELTRPSQWRWVPTKENPADEATRPDKNRNVTYDSRWYKGPDFLKKPEEEWPKEKSQKEAMEVADSEEIVCAATECYPVNKKPIPEVSRFSDYNRLLNTTARVFQFVDCLRSRQRVPLQVKHRNKAEHLLFQYVQRTSFPEKYRSLAKKEVIHRKSRIFDLDPILDEDGLIRMRGRLNAAPVQGLEKRPVILDGRHRVVQLLIGRAHKEAGHANNERVVNDLRQLYWVVHLRPTVRQVACKCRLCILRKTQPKVPAMGDLPLARIEPYKRPFTNTAVDLFGPLNVAIGRRREKRWVALFTCLTTRAVHLEIVHSLSTDTAIMALRRLAARRGWPAVMYSDNATNFRGADVELRGAYKEWLPALQEFGVQKNITWRFIPPGAPNQGGAWERLVRSVKNALTATLHTRAPREELLLTVLAEAENTVNSRPLTHVSVNPNDEEALTPAHFLLGGSTGVPPTGPCEEADRRTWRASQALADHFWKRWVREYLPTLAPRESSANDTRPIRKGDYVIIVDGSLPRNVWPRGIVVEVYPGPDGGVRSADVKTKGGVFRRPVTKLAVLPLQQEQPQQRQRGQTVTESLYPS